MLRMTSLILPWEWYEGRESKLDDDPATKTLKDDPSI